MKDSTVPIARAAQGQEPPAGAEKAERPRILNYGPLFDQTSECVFIIGLDLTYVAANRQALDLLGYEDREMVGMPVSEVVSLDERLAQAHFLEEGSSLYERILRRKDGTTVPVEVSTSLVYETDDEPAYIQCIARDISERKIVEGMLRKQARILSLLSDAAARLLQSSNIESRIPEVIEGLGKAMDVVSCSVFEIDTVAEMPKVKIHYAWTRTDRPDFKLSDAIISHVSSVWHEAHGCFHEASGKGASSELSFGVVPILSSRGLWRFVGLFDDRRANSWSTSEQEAIQTAADLIGSALQRSDYEDAIRLSEARNRIILSALPDLLIRVDIDGTILDYSTNPKHPLYVHRDVISGKRLMETWPEEVVRQIMGDSLEQGFEAQRVLERFTLPFSSGEYEARLYAIDAREALIVVRDISEQLQLDEMKSDFINRASHELRTPVTSAILMAELIQEGGTSQELDEYWRTLKSELNRQKILIDRLLIAGRLESGMMQLEHVPVDLGTAVADSVETVKPIANKRQVLIQVKIPAEPMLVVGDKSALEQVFINLINNAAKFSAEGGTVEIDVSEAGPEVSVAIRDHGLGIPPEAVSHLFERFYRAKNVTVAEIPGSGIGLYIVKTIVEDLGGRITVESVLKEGTTFVVTLKKAD